MVAGRVVEVVITIVLVVVEVLASSVVVVVRVVRSVVGWRSWLVVGAGRRGGRQPDLDPPILADHGTQAAHRERPDAHVRGFRRAPAQGIALAGRRAVHGPHDPHRFAWRRRPGVEPQDDLPPDLHRHGVGRRLPGGDARQTRRPHPDIPAPARHARRSGHRQPDDVPPDVLRPRLEGPRGSGADRRPVELPAHGRGVRRIDREHRGLAHPDTQLARLRRRRRDRAARVGRRGPRPGPPSPGDDDQRGEGQEPQHAGRPFLKPGRLAMPGGVDHAGARAWAARHRGAAGTAQV